MADERKYYVLCRDNCKFEGMTKEQIYAAIAEATGNVPTGIDDAFITKLVDQNKKAAMLLWIGTEAEYNAIVASGEIDTNTIYAIRSGDVVLLKTPTRGIDYWTYEDKQEIIKDATETANAAANNAASAAQTAASDAASAASSASTAQTAASDAASAASSASAAQTAANEAKTALSNLKTEKLTFTYEDGSTATKEVYIK